MMRPLFVYLSVFHGRFVKRPYGVFRRDFDDLHSQTSAPRWMRKALPPSSPSSLSSSQQVMKICPP